ncbi:MAG: hypothetical protein IPH57_03365 [Saprospiraceae bacterium]|nr:hypothetical protein [Saprospiraceae bacterium]
MVKNKIFSFSARLRSAQDLLANISQFEGFNPPRPEESVAGIKALIDSIIVTNQAESADLRDYRLVVKERQMIFFQNSDSVVKMFPTLKEMIKSQYGNRSGEVAILSTIVKKMRSSKAAAVAVDNAAEGSEQVRSMKRSEKSFASMTKNFNDFVIALEGFVDFKPVQEPFRIETLKVVTDRLTDLNDSVAEKINKLTIIRFERLQKYKDLSERLLRIKSFVRAHYGTESAEYKILQGFRF